MGKRKNKLRILLAIACIVSQILSYTGCVRNVYKFDQERINVKTVEIVEADYFFETGRGTQNSLVVVDDVDSFLKELERIEYKKSLSEPDTIEKRTLAVKISYKNGDYEVFDSENKSSVIIENEGVYRGRVFGSFDTDAFYDLLFDYLCNVKKCEYNYMHVVSEIQSIEIVKTVAQYNSFSYETIVKIDDKASFIEELRSIDYVYVNDDICDGVYDYKDQNPAIKITYQNGDYEVFSFNHRDEAQVLNDGSTIYRTGSYIGTFNKQKFDQLIEKYLNTNWLEGWWEWLNI